MLQESNSFNSCIWKSLKKCHIHNKRPQINQGLKISNKFSSLTNEDVHERFSDQEEANCEKHTMVRWKENYTQKIKSRTQQKVCLDKKSLETRNYFNVFETFSELEIDQILQNNEMNLGEKSDTNGRKKKCKQCNFKTSCHLNLSECKASKGTCFACKKINHFH